MRGINVIHGDAFQRKKSSEDRGKPYDGCFSKIGEIEIWWISVSKGVNVFQDTPFKDVRILR